MQAAYRYLRDQPTPQKTPLSERFSWQPQERQADLLRACGALDYLYGGAMREPVAPILGYGGAAGGGKTDTMLALGRIICDAYAGAMVTYFRRTYPELEGPDGAILRSQAMYDDAGQYRTDKHRWDFPNKSKLFFRHMQAIKDMYKLQSTQMHVILVDEATHFTWEMIDYMITRNRTTVAGLRPFVVMGSNPGNIGHLWYMQLFDVHDNSGGEQGKHGQVKTIKSPNGTLERTMFIPARLEDNQILMKLDPEYEAKLRRRAPDLVEALRFGNWQIFAGQVLREWRRELHVCEVFELPEHWPKWRAIDWGYAKPFVCLWLAMDPDIGRIYVYRELVKTRLSDTEQAKLIVAYTGEERIEATYADPSVFNEKGGDIDTTDKAYKKMGVLLRRGDNKRIQGKRKVHRYLKEMGPDGLPMLRVFENCTYLIKTLPALTSDILNPEDVDTQQDDHGYDALRYGLTRIREPEKEENEEEANEVRQLTEALGRLL